MPAQVSTVKIRDVAVKLHRVGSGPPVLAQATPQPPNKKTQPTKKKKKKTDLKIDTDAKKLRFDPEIAEQAGA